MNANGARATMQTTLTEAEHDTFADIWYIKIVNSKRKTYLFNTQLQQTILQISCSDVVNNPQKKRHLSFEALISKQWTVKLKHTLASQTEFCLTTTAVVTTCPDIFPNTFHTVNKGNENRSLRVIDIPWEQLERRRRFQQSRDWKQQTLHRNTAFLALLLWNIWSSMYFSVLCQIQQYRPVLLFFSLFVSEERNKTTTAHYLDVLLVLLKHAVIKCSTDFLCVMKINTKFQLGQNRVINNGKVNFLSHHSLLFWWTFLTFSNHPFFSLFLTSCFSKYLWNPARWRAENREG